MAKSPSHRFGQIIGDLLEVTLIRYCRPVATSFDMYLDYKHSRPARNGQNEVRWTDINDNKHKLDIVIEQNGNENVMGQPRAFIEMAWRRYTKHSKNKAQEITAAIKPLVSRYAEYAPFYGAVLAGEFTNNSINQMKSEGFEVLYFSIDEIERAFMSQGVNAHWDEDTSEDDLQDMVYQAEALTDIQLNAIGDYLMTHNNTQWVLFKERLEHALERDIESIFIRSLYGIENSFKSIEDACQYIAQDTNNVYLTDENFCRYEILVTYSNGDKIDMQFKEKRTALMKLRQLE